MDGEIAVLMRGKKGKRRRGRRMNLNTATARRPACVLLNCWANMFYGISS